MSSQTQTRPTTLRRKKGAKKSERQLRLMNESTSFLVAQKEQEEDRRVLSTCPAKASGRRKGGYVRPL